jgi:hypothetical protein
MSADHDILYLLSVRPNQKQGACYVAMKFRYPFGCDMYVIRSMINNVFYGSRNCNCRGFQKPRYKLKFPALSQSGGLNLSGGCCLFLLEEFLQAAILTGSFSNSMDFTTQSRTFS